MTSAFHTPSESCDEVLGNLPLFVGRDLDPVDLSSIEEHLAGCAPCTEELTRAVKARAALLELRTAVPAAGSLDLWGKGLGEQIREASTSEAAPETLAPIYRFRPLRVAGLAAAAGLLAVVGFQFLSSPGGGGAPSNGSPAPIVPTMAEVETPPISPASNAVVSIADPNFRLASNAQPAAMAPPPFVVSCSTPGCEDAERIAQEGGEGLRRVHIENLDEYRESMPVLGGPPTVIGPQRRRMNPVRTVSWK